MLEAEKRVQAEQIAALQEALESDNAHYVTHLLNELGTALADGELTEARVRLGELREAHDGLLRELFALALAEGCAAPAPGRESLFAFAVNGQATQIEAAPETPLSEILATAILQTGNERWGGESAWESRTPRGELLDGSTRLRDLVPNERGIHAFVGLKPGWGA
jgi:hypothetical protein